MVTQSDTNCSQLVLKLSYSNCPKITFFWDGGRGEVRNIMAQSIFMGQESWVCLETCSPKEILKTRCLT